MQSAVAATTDLTQNCAHKANHSQAPNEHLTPPCESGLQRVNLYCIFVVLYLRTVEQWFTGVMSVTASRKDAVQVLGARTAKPCWPASKVHKDGVIAHGFRDLGNRDN